MPFMKLLRGRLSMRQRDINCSCTYTYIDVDGLEYCTQCGALIEDDVEDEVESTQCVACLGTGISSKGLTCNPCKGTGIRFVDEVKSLLPIFVYGTLKAGGPLAYLWSRGNHVKHVEETSIFGTLYTLGAFPAALTECDLGGCNLIAGELLWPKSEEDLEAMLTKLDRAEGVDSGLYRRLTVDTVRNQQCYMYEYCTPADCTLQRLMPGGIWNLETEDGYGTATT